MKKYWRTNQDTAINQRPLVQLGQKVKARARCSPTAPPPTRGELALGSNVTGGVHALVRPQLRGRHRPLRAAGEGRRVLVDPHPGARAARPRHQARAGGDHARNPERRRGVAGRPRRARHRAHRRAREAGRHPRRQDHAEGRDGAVAGREAAHRHLRREGEGREGLVAQGAAGHGRRRHRREDLLAHRRPGRREGPRRADRRGAPARGRGEDPRINEVRDEELRRAARRADGRARAQGGHGRGGDRRRAPSSPTDVLRRR